MKLIGPQRMALLIIDACASFYGIRTAVIVGPYRSTAMVTTARHVAMFFVRKHTRLSFPEIGRIFNRDHTTVMSGVDHIRKERKRSKTACDETDAIETELFAILEGRAA